MLISLIRCPQSLIDSRLCLIGVVLSIVKLPKRLRHWTGGILLLVDPMRAFVSDCFPFSCRAHRGEGVFAKTNGRDSVLCFCGTQSLWVGVGEVDLDAILISLSTVELQSFV